MMINYAAQEYRLDFNEYGAMFMLLDEEGDVVRYLCGRSNPGAGFNQTWLDSSFLLQMESLGIVKAVMRDGEPVRGDISEQLVFGVTLVDIIHPNFHDGGYSPFGDFCRSRLGQQCQYGSRYIDGRLEGYPNLGEGLRFNNGKGYRGETRPLDARDYHAVRIHRDDMDEFERRYKAYHEERSL